MIRLMSWIGKPRASGAARREYMLEFSWPETRVTGEVTIAITARFLEADVTHYSYGCEGFASITFVWPWAKRMDIGPASHAAICSSVRWNYCNAIRLHNEYGELV